MSAACLWNRDGHLIPVTVLRTEGDDIPAGHYEAWVIPTGTTEFVPITDLAPHRIRAEVKNPKHSKENDRG